MSSVRKNSWWRSLFSRTAPIQKHQNALNYRPSFMGLEERITPAFNTTLSLLATSGMSVVTAAGTTTYTSTAAGANVSSLDISTQLNSGNNVVIDTGSTGTEAGNISAPSLASISYANAANKTLTFRSGSGAGLVGDISLPNITLTAPGSILVRANHDFVGNGLNAQSLDIRAATGSITSTDTLEGTDLFLRSATGIGTLGTPILTQVTNLTAKTTSSGSGIFITEADDLSLANANGVNGIEANNGQIGLSTTDGNLDTNGTQIFSANASITITVGGLDNTFNNSSGLVQTFDQPIAITADRMVLGSGADGIHPDAGTVSLDSYTANRPINLGSASDPTGSLNISSAEIGTITTTASLVKIGSAASGTITTSAAITFAHNLTLTTGSGVTGSGDYINGSASARNLTIDQAGDSTYSGRIGGPSGGTAAQKNIALTKLGIGSLKLTGSNTYTGTTTVTGGTLIVNGTSGTGATTVQTGATIGGTGTIGNNTTNLTIQNGGTLSPGDGGIGTLTVGHDLFLNAGSTFFVDIGSGASADRVNARIADVDDGALLLGNVTLPVNSAAYTLIGTSVGMALGATGFKDVNGNNLPPLTGGPNVVGDQPFSYQYGNTGFKLTAVATTVSVDGSGNLLVSDSLGENNNLTVARNGAYIRVTDPTNIIFAGPGAIQIDGHTVDVLFTSVTGKLQIDSNTGTDSLTLNLANGLLPPGGFNFDGGASGTNDVTVNGTTSADQLTYRATTGVPGGTEFNLNGGLFNNTMTGANHFSFNGLGGVDTLTVDYVNGNPVATGGIDFDGGTGVNDTLVVTSPLAAGRSGSYQPSGTTPGSGKVVVGTDDIRFANLTPVDVSGMVNFTVLLPNSNDTVDITGGASFSNPMQDALIFSGNSNAVPFESLSAWNITNLTLDTTTIDGVDAITLENTGLAADHLVTNLTLTTGSAADTVGVSGTVNLGGSLTFDLGTGANVLTFTTATVSAPTGISQTGAGSNTLAGGTTSLNTTTGDINLANNINGTVVNTQSLSMTTTSGNIIVSSIGNSTALNTLTMTTTSGNLQLNGSTYHAGTQTYSGPVALSAASVLFDGTTLNGPITLNSTLTGVGSNVTVTTLGNTNFNGAVSVASLHTNGGGTTNVKASTVTSVNGQTYDDAVVLVTDTTFTSTGSGAISFNSTLDSIVGTPRSAIVTTAGATTFGGAVGANAGDSKELLSLTTNSGGTTSINGGSIRTTTFQQYYDAVLLGVNTTLTSTLGYDIAFFSTLNGPGGLTTVTTGPTVFGDVVGGSSPLAFITSGLTDVNASAITTTGAQSYGDTTLSVNCTYTTTNSNVTFNGFLMTNSGTNITFALGTGNLVFTGTVSNVGDLRINSAKDVTVNGLMTVSSFVQTAGTGTTRFNGNTNLVHTALAGTSRVSITTNKVELNANLDAGLFDMRFNTVAGVNQISGAITAGRLRLAGGGTFTLNGLANNIQTDFGANLTTVGTISLRTANNLVVDPVAGIHTINSDVNLFAAKNFEAINPAATLIDLGGIAGGIFSVTPGETSDSLAIFNTKISARLANFGNPTLGTGNIHKDSFNIRPSETTPIYVWGNLPQTLPGDSLNANLSDLDPGETVNFVVTTPPDQVNKSGYYQFTNGTRQTLYFNDIETIANNISVSEVLSYQTLIGQYSLRFLATIDGHKLGNLLPQFSVPENQFVVAPRYVNPNAPFSAPRIALSDINGDGFADVIVGNGSNKAPLVSIIDGRSIADNVLFPTQIKLLTQFYAFEPNFVGGVFVAAGDVNGDSKNDIVVGSDSGRTSQVRIFTFNSGTQKMDLLSTHNMPSTFGTKGARVAVGSVQGLTAQNIVVGSGPGVQNRVVVLDTTPAHSPLRNFSPYPATFKGGVFVAVGKYDGDNKADVLIGPGAGAMPDKKAPRIFVLSGAQLSLGLPPAPPAVPTTNSWYLFNQYAQFTIAPTGIQPLSWINAQGVSSVSFARTTPGPLTIVVGAARGLGTQLVRYTSAAGTHQDYFIESVYSTDVLFSSNLYKNFRDGAAIATLV